VVVEAMAESARVGKQVVNESALGRVQDILDEASELQQGVKEIGQLIASGGPTAADTDEDVLAEYDKLVQAQKATQIEEFSIEIPSIHGGLEERFADLLLPPAPPADVVPSVSSPTSHAGPIRAAPQLANPDEESSL
jgi:hypothetical protein